MRKHKRKAPNKQDEDCTSRERIRELEIENAELRESKEKLQALFEHAPDAYYLYDLKGTLVDGNAAAEAVIGYEREVLIGKNLLRLNLLSPRDLPRAAAALARNAAGQSTGPDEFMLNRKDGTHTPVEIRTHPVKIGGRTLVLGLARDITKRRQAEKALRESEHYLNEAQALAHLGHWKLDPATQEITGSDELFRIFGLDREEATLDAFVQVVHPDDRELDTSHIKRGIEFGEDWDIQHRLICRDGAEKNVHAIGHVIADETGKTILLLGTVQDITERMEAQVALREREQESRAFIETSRDWIWSIDLQGIHTYSNPAIEAILGYKPDELVGQPSLDLLHPDDRRDVEAKLPNWIAEKRAWRNQVLRWRNKSGDWRWLESNAVPTFDSAGDLSGFRGVDRDITERVKAAEDLRSALEGTIQAVAEMIETRDPYTSGHQQRVARLAVAIGRRLDLPNQQVEGIRVAATLHDIGKMSTPAEILSKPGRLSEPEMRLIQEHPKVAHSILEGIALPWPVADIVLQHHERLDGTGYPNRLAGEEILLEARIIAVADTVEAVSSHRPYRPALGVDEALAEIKKHKGILYDSDVVDACVALFVTGEFALDV